MRRWMWRYKLLATLFTAASVCILINVLLFASMTPSPPASHRLTQYDVDTPPPHVLVRMLQQRQQQQQHNRDAELGPSVTASRSMFPPKGHRGHEQEYEKAKEVSEAKTGKFQVQLPEQVIQAPVIRENADMDNDVHWEDDSLHMLLENLSMRNKRRRKHGTESEHKQSDVNGVGIKDNDDGVLVKRNDTDQKDENLAVDKKNTGKHHADTEKQISFKDSPQNDLNNGTDDEIEKEWSNRRQLRQRPDGLLAEVHEPPRPPSDHDERNIKGGSNEVISHAIAATERKGGDSLMNNLDIAELTRLLALLQQNIEAFGKQQRQHAADFRYHPRNIHRESGNPDVDDLHQIQYDSEKLIHDQHIKREDNRHDKNNRHRFERYVDDGEDTAAEYVHEVGQAPRRVDKLNKNVFVADSEARHFDRDMQERQDEDWRAMKYQDDAVGDVRPPDTHRQTRNTSDSEEQVYNQRETDEEQQNQRRRRANLPHVGLHEQVLASNSTKNLNGIDYQQTDSITNSTEEVIKDYEVRQGPFDPDGPGEEGRPVQSEAEDAASVESGWKMASFNQFVSDKISLERSVPDTRHAACRLKTYNYFRLPRASVVICFTDESWSTLLRTVHSVINRTPPRLLEEILLVDDFSQLAHLHQQLDDYIAANFPAHKVRLVRLSSRQGLIRARLLGVQLARAPVAVFLDSHVECNRGWLEPLLATIVNNPQTVASPVIDVLQADTFAYVPAQDDVHGGFDWKLTFQWLQLPDRILMQRRLGDGTELIDTPTIAGGIFAIDVTFFKRLGMYDPYLEVWGSENLELSFKTWMCGGRLVIVPCSRVGHVFRSTHPYSFPAPGGMFATVLHNSARVAEVWLDEYKLLFYRHFPWLHDQIQASYGDLTERQLLRKRLRCHSFTWYLDNVFPELYRPSLYPAAHGQLRNAATGACMAVASSGRLVCRQCDDPDAAQYIQLTTDGRLEMLEKCVGTTGENVEAVDCSWETLTVHVRHRGPGDVLQVVGASYGDALSHCITASHHDNDTVLVLRPCLPQQRTDQQWAFTDYNEPTTPSEGTN